MGGRRKRLPTFSLDSVVKFSDGRDATTASTPYRKPFRYSITSSARAIRSLFRPHCHRGSDCGCNCLNQPTVLALRNDSEAIRLRVLPGRAKALRIKFPRATVLVAGFCERLTGHLAVRRKRHSEFGAARCRGSEGLAVEESCLDIARSHR